MEGFSSNLAQMFISMKHFAKLVFDLASAQGQGHT